MNILIVDDERVILDGIEELVRSSGFGIDNIFTAASAAKALEIMDSTQVDILLSDIKMPGMSGFELYDRVRETVMPELILITGFAEFEYAQKALNSGAVGYILKPIDEKQLYDALKKAIRRVVEKKLADTGRTQEETECERILNAVFRGESVSEGQLEYIARSIAPSGIGQKYILATFHISADGDAGLLMWELQERASEYFKRRVRGGGVLFFGTDSGRLLHCLYIGSEPECIERICRDFTADFRPAVPAQIRISVSDARGRLTRELYTHSIEAYYDRLLDGERSVLTHKSSSIQMVSGIESELKLIDIAISNEDMSGLKALLDRIFSREYIINSTLTVKAVYFLTANTVILTFSRLNAGMSAAQVDELLSEKPLLSVSGVAELADFVYAAVFDVLMEQSSNKGMQMTILKIISYVDANFDRELSVKELSNMFALTPNYLSQMFKKETGENFVAYLNRLRIDKACEYLRTANIKIHEISGLVGYRDSQYFYRVFKKYTGCTPIEYRMNEK